MTAASSRLLALDGARGLAAFAVFGYHLTNYRFPAHGAAAVDLFFMLSGFVLASVYEDRLRAGLSFWAFAGQRVARLYPLYLLGVTGGLMLSLPTQGFAALSAWLWNLVLLAPSPTPGGAAFWLDPPMWSLSLEMAVNLVFALALWKASSRMLVALTGIAGTVLAIAIVALGQSDFGWQKDALGFGLGDARVLFGFPLGWLAWRFRETLARGCSRRASILAVVAVVAALALPGGAAHDLVSLFALFPLAVVALALGPQPTGPLGQACGLAGALSYPLYATHPLVLSTMLGLFGGGYLAQLLAVSALALLVAWVAHRTVEPFGRRMLTAAFSSPAVAAEARTG